MLRNLNINTYVYVQGERSLLLSHFSCSSTFPFSVRKECAAKTRQAMYSQKNNFAVGYFKVLIHFSNLSQYHSRGEISKVGQSMDSDHTLHTTYYTVTKGSHRTYQDKDMQVACV